MGASGSKQVISRSDLQQRRSVTNTDNAADWQAILGGGGYADDETMSMGTLTSANYQVRSAQMKQRLFQKLTPLEKIIVESN